MNEARYAYVSELSVSSYDKADGDILQSINTLDLPDKVGFNNRVNFDVLQGTYQLALHSADKQLPKASSDLLIALPSVILIPSAAVRRKDSAPAKSTISSRLPYGRRISKTACERLEAAFSAVPPVERELAADCSFDFTISYG